MKKKKIPSNFIYKIINKDLCTKKCIKIRTRFPPEPNGYLHLGHAKSICLNFQIAKNFQGTCNLRFDDTNPKTQHKKYIEAIKNDIKWLRFQWYGTVRYASDYFDKIYYFAIELIKKNLAYVEELSSDEIRKYRGSLTKIGQNSPYRDRSIQENLYLFEKMRNGNFTEGSACLRAKIDMKSPFIIMRDPILYRIRFRSHHHTKNKWCIYPTYDFSHCISDAIEEITHSLCTLEFQDNRQLYNWILKNVSIQFLPKQYEFSRINLEYTVMSKRKLKILVKNNIVDGWDDPRMPTISGLRRRGYTPSSIRAFCNLIGITKQNNIIDISLLESCIKKELNVTAIRFMAVINPVLLILENLADTYEKVIEVFNHPNNHNMGKRKIFLHKKIYIDRSDFSEKQNILYKRLSLGKKVKLRHSYVIIANRIEKNETGEIKTIFCTCYKKYDKNSELKDSNKIGVIHWVSAKNNIPAEFRFYQNLFTHVNPDNIKDFLSFLNPNSLKIYHGVIENSITKNHIKYPIQFERIGYFFADQYNNNKNLIFNLITHLSKKWKIV
ncbi:glutamine--tRNA ligase [Wigglesworthia glossinidia]|nr:glutamine--tRNA ligase [Wigglesworthia glossinidia]